MRHCRGKIEVQAMHGFAVLHCKQILAEIICLIDASSGSDYGLFGEIR
jgi:hypothetical protein